MMTSFKNSIPVSRKRLILSNILIRLLGCFLKLFIDIKLLKVKFQSCQNLLIKNHLFLSSLKF